MSELDNVELICIKQGSKLRVRIISQGYINYANCQFPKDLRIEGRRFKVKSEYIKLITQKGRWFYSIKKKNCIEIVDNISSEELSKIKIYEDEDIDECSICMNELKNDVFYPCGHFYTCKNCSNKLSKCPYCKQNIENRIDKKLID